MLSYIAIFNINPSVHIGLNPPKPSLLLSQTCACTSTPYQMSYSLDVDMRGLGYRSMYVYTVCPS